MQATSVRLRGRARRWRWSAIAAALGSALVLVPASIEAQAQGQGARRPTRATSPVVRRAGTHPLSFEEHGADGRGRTFVSRGPGYALTLTSADAAIAVHPRAGGTSDNAHSTAPSVVRMSLVDAARRNGVGVDVLPGTLYHVTGTTGPLAGQRTFRRVKYEQVYPGIDAVYHGDGGRLEFDFVVAPNADPSRIRLAFSGVEALSLNDAGNLSLRARSKGRGEEVVLHKPVAYQEIDGVRREVRSTFVVGPGRAVRFALGAYDRTRPLVIDPTITFAGYFGTEFDDSILGLESDAAGNVYTFGTVPAGFGTLTVPPTDFFGPQSLASAPADCFVGKFAPNQDGALISSWLAIFHDSRTCEAMTVGPDGRIFVARTLADERVTVEVLADTAGLALERRVPLPPLASATHLRVSDFGALYAVGGCSTESFAGELWPLPNGFQPGPAGLPAQCGPDAANSQHLILIANDAGDVFYGSFFGFASSQLTPTALDIEPGGGRAYIAGYTRIGPGHTLITTPNARQPQPGDAGCEPNEPGCNVGDAFLIVVDPAQAADDTLAYASYFGGRGRENAVAMTIDAHGLVHLIGNTESWDSLPNVSFDSAAIFKIVLDIDQPPSDQIVDVVSLVDEADTTLLNEWDSGARFRLLPDGSSALLASAGNAAFPLVGPLFDEPRDQSLPTTKPLLLVHRPAEGIVFASYLDDTSLAERPHLAVAPDGVLYVAMETTEFGRSTDGTVPLGRDVLLFGVDGIGQVAPNNPPIAQAGGDRTVVSSSPLGTRVTLYGGLSFDQDGDTLTYTWTEGATELATDSLVEVFLTPGDHVITLTVDDGRGGVDTDTITVRIVPNTTGGGPQTVTPPDLSWTRASSYPESPVTVHFTNVMSTGYTSLKSRYEVSPVPPPGMQFGSPPLYFDLATTAQFTGGVQACVDYRGMSFARPDADVRLYQEVNGTWVLVPQTNDPSARAVCGTAETLGTFALFTPAVRANEIALLAGQPLLSPSCRQNQGLDPNDGGFALDSSLCNTRGLALDATRNYLYFAEAGHGDVIRRLDLVTNRITTVAGTGFITGSIDGVGGDPRDDDKNNVDPLTAPLNQVLGLALDAAGNLLLVEYGTGRIRKIDFTQNRIYTVANVSGVSRPSTLAIDAAGALLFSGFADGERRIWRLTPGADGVLNGSPDETVRSVAGTSAQGFDVSLIPPEGIDSTLVPIPNEAVAFGPDGSLYSAGYQGHAAVVRITPGPDGLIDGVGDTAFVVAGGRFAPLHLGDGTAATSAQLFLPNSIVVAPNGDVYVGDTGSPWGASVRKISAVDGVVTGAPDETITTVAGFHIYDPAFSMGTDLPFSNGDGHALSAIFGANFNLLVLPNGDLLVNDFYQIRRIGPRGDGNGDTTPPVLTLPGPIVVEAEGLHGAVVTFLATALDDVDGSVAVSCSPASGSTFSFNGTAPTATTVNCSAIDSGGNTASGTFTVTVRDTTAPVVTAPPALTVAATEASGARANVPQAPNTSALLAFLAGGTGVDLADAGPSRLMAQRVDCSQPASVLESITATTIFTVGQNCIDVAFRDSSGNVGRAIAALAVLPPIGGQVNAAGVTVVATDANNTPLPVTASFAALQQPGLLTAAGVTPPAPAPAGFTFRGSAFDVRATALAPPAAVVCLLVPGIQQGDRLLLFDNGAWADRTATVDPSAPRICSVPTSLGVYAIAGQSVVNIDVVETIVVTDAVGVQPSARVEVIEQILVTDVATPLPAARIDVAEQVLVSDTAVPVTQPVSVIVLTLTPETAEVAAGTAVTWTATVGDGSDENARVLLTAVSGQPRVQFAHPGATNSPLTVSANGQDFVVTLATDSSGALSSTASHVAMAINAFPSASGVLVAETWPGSAGGGIVQPRGLAPLATVRIAVGAVSPVICLTSVPGWCTASYARPTPGTESVMAFLDVNGNGSRDAAEPFDTAEVTWVDHTPPTLTLPGNLGIVATATTGAPVSFTVSAVDAVDGPVSVTCTPASGSTFPIGTTSVVCTAVDQAGNTASGSFNVTVSTSLNAVLQLASLAVFTKDAAGQYVGSITVGNAGSTEARDVRVTTAILNTTSGTLLPVQFGDIQPGTRSTRQITFAASSGSAGPATLRMTFAWIGGMVSVTQRVQLPAATAPLWGWVDLHTHPMSNLAFAGKLFHGAPDAGSLMPAIQMPYDPQCRFDVRAINIAEALSDDAPTHGDPFQSKCGNFARNALVQALELFNGAATQPAHAVGFPTFTNWPRWNDITHQKMWVDWIRRARDGGLRVMVALSHNNRTLGELMGAGGPISGVTNDQGSSDLQITEIKAFVARHSDLMKVALTPDDLYQTVQDGKIAVLLGVEVDNIGNFNDLGNVTTTMVEGEIARLYAQGIRYVFPVHLTDNRFGDTAIYNALFNIPNRRETGSFWTVGCGGQFSQIGFRSVGLPSVLNLFLPPGVPAPPQGPLCLTGNGLFLGHVNARTPTGLTSLGAFAIRSMMRRGMIVDVDHLSDRAVETVLGIAESVPGGGYPLVSGHSAVRDGNQFNAENSRSRSQLQRIGCLQGMFGLGSDGAEAYKWASQYMDAFTEMGRPTALCPDKSSLGRGRVALGTDTNALVSGPRPTLTELKPGTPPRFTDIYNAASGANDNPLLPALSRSTAGSKVWDYNTDGVAHYGMFADFVKDVRTAPVSPALSVTGKNLVDNHLLQSADYFFRMWQRIETQKTNVP